MKIKDLYNLKLIALEHKIAICDEINCEKLYDGIFMKAAKQFKDKEVTTIAADDDKLLIFVKQMCGNSLGNGSKKAERNISINKPGGTASKNSRDYRISLPSEMVKQLGVTEEDRAVELEFLDGSIIIRKK